MSLTARRRNIVCLAALLSYFALLRPFAAVAQQASDKGKPVSTPAPVPNALLGTWKVDLRPTPDAPAYYQYFVVKSVEGGITGTFYQSTLHDGRIDKSWDTVYFAFTTKDASGGVYNTSGRLVNGHLEGTTHSIGRGFLSVWKAKRVDSASESGTIR